MVCGSAAGCSVFTTTTLMRKVFVAIREEVSTFFDAFELWCWRRLLKVPWTARRSKQSILKEISPEYSLEYWNILKYIGIY